MLILLYNITCFGAHNAVEGRVRWCVFLMFFLVFLCDAAEYDPGVEIRYFPRFGERSSVFFSKGTSVSCPDGVCRFLHEVLFEQVLDGYCAWEGSTWSEDAFASELRIHVCDKRVFSSEPIMWYLEKIAHLLLDNVGVAFSENPRWRTMTTADVRALQRRGKSRRWCVVSPDAAKPGICEDRVYILFPDKKEALCGVPGSVSNTKGVSPESLLSLKYRSAPREGCDVPSEFLASLEYCASRSCVGIMYSDPICGVVGGIFDFCSLTVPDVRGQDTRVREAFGALCDEVLEGYVLCAPVAKLQKFDVMGNVAVREAACVRRCFQSCVIKLCLQKAQELCKSNTNMLQDGDWCGLRVECFDAMFREGSVMLWSLRQKVDFGRFIKEHRLPLGDVAIFPQGCPVAFHGRSCSYAHASKFVSLAPRLASQKHFLAKPKRDDV